jgi:hypothetical protein
MIQMRLFFQLVALTFAVLIFYVNWTSSYVAVEIHGGAEDALGQQRIVVKQSRNALRNFQDPSADSNEIDDGLDSKKDTTANKDTASAASQVDEIHEIQEAKLMISELQAKLMELDERIPKKFPEVSFRLLDRKRILVPINTLKFWQF